MKARMTAEPAKPNQNGAVTPQSDATAPPIAEPITRPPTMLVRYTLLTRPWYSAGTARCRTLVEVAP